VVFCSAGKLKMKPVFVGVSVSLAGL
jgi:hypothetical protein